MKTNEIKNEQEKIFHHNTVFALSILGAILVSIIAGCQVRSTSDVISIPTSTPVAPEPELLATDESTDLPKYELNTKDNATMVYVTAGEYLMGNRYYVEEKPIHAVYVDSFWLYQIEVTNAQYALFLQEKGNGKDGEIPWFSEGSGIERIQFVDGNWQVDDGYADHPVVSVTWYGAKAYCEWSGGRLPTEAEWERGARGWKKATYPWSGGLDCEHANHSKCVGDTTPVGSYPNGASPFGALDMCGNVWEWVNDWYAVDYYSDSPYENPPGPPSGEFRILRGGSWGYGGAYLKTTTRYYATPGGATSTIGFRCVVDDGEDF